MVYGLTALKAASKQQLVQQKLLDEAQVDPYFDHLIQSLSQFQTAA